MSFLRRCFIWRDPLSLRGSTVYNYYATVYVPLDINECAMGTDNCAPEATCTNTEGSFTCTCNHGYTGSGTVCTGRFLGPLFVSMIYRSLYLWEIIINSTFAYFTVVVCGIQCICETGHKIED